jgi:hypothetical protein
MLPEIQKVVLDKHKWRTYYYGNFAPEDGGGRESSRIDPANPGNTTWRTFDHRPRFGNNYAGLRNRIAILSEAYSYLDFKSRVEVTEDFVEEIFHSAVSHAKTIMALTAQADRQFTAPPNTRPALSEARASGASPRRVEGPVELGIDIEIRALPQRVDILVGDVKKVSNPKSGRDMNAMTDMAVAVPMKDYGTFTATTSWPMPKGWVIPANPRLAAALDRLRWHGVQLREVTEAAQVPVERFSIADYTRAERPFQGHREARLKGSFDKVQFTVAPGAFFVPANQPLARLAFYLLEPESDDGLVTWNVIEEGLAAGQTYPIYRVTDATGLKLK